MSSGSSELSASICPRGTGDSIALAALKGHDGSLKSAAYLHDESQAVARAYGAVCTPDFFGYDKDRKLKYRGRLDAGRTSPPPKDAKRELLEAMRAIGQTGEAPKEQTPTIGCSIKWKA